MCKRYCPLGFGISLYITYHRLIAVLPHPSLSWFTHLRLLPSLLAYTCTDSVSARGSICVQKSSFFLQFLKSRGFCLLVLFDATFPSRELSHANAIFTRFVFILSASDECAAAGDDWSRQVCRGPRGAVPCGSVPILLPPSAFPARARTRTHQHHRDIKPATNPLVVVVIIPIPDTLVLSRLASSAARGSGNVRGEGERGRPRGSHRSSGRRCWRCSIGRWRRARRGCGSRAPRGTRSPSTLAGPAPWRSPRATRTPSSPGESSLLCFCIVSVGGMRIILPSLLGHAQCVLSDLMSDPRFLSRDKLTILRDYRLQLVYVPARYPQNQCP
jgi:hypothetical protein